MSFLVIEEEKQQEGESSSLGVGCFIVILECFDENCAEVSFYCWENRETYSWFFPHHHRVGHRHHHHHHHRVAHQPLHSAPIPQYHNSHFGSELYFLSFRWAVIAGSWVFWNREAQRWSWIAAQQLYTYLVDWFIHSLFWIQNIQDQTKPNLPYLTSWPTYQPDLPTRVAKCHGYDGFIRVKILAGWGKRLGQNAIWQNQASC